MAKKLLIDKLELLSYLGSLKYSDIVDSPDKMFNPDELIFGIRRVIREFPTVTGEEVS